MSQLLALSLSIGLLGGIATMLYLKVGLLIWAGFIAWAGFFDAGGDNPALRKTIVGNAFGAFCAWVAAMILGSIHVTGEVYLVRDGIVVGLTVLGMCLAAHFKALSSIPASVYGYAAVFGFLFQDPGAWARDRLIGLHQNNPLIMVVLSMVLGALFGAGSARMAAAIRKG